METAPAIDQAVDCFGAHTVESHPDVRDRTAHTIIRIHSGEGSAVTVSSTSPFAEMVQATRPYTESEADHLL